MSHELIPEPLRRDLLRYLAAASEERARLIGELGAWNPGMGSLLMDLEADDASAFGSKSSCFGRSRDRSSTAGPTDEACYRFSDGGRGCTASPLTLRARYELRAPSSGKTTSTSRISR
jgi:hypothetical protein